MSRSPRLSVSTDFRVEFMFVIRIIAVVVAMSSCSLPDRSTANAQVVPASGSREVTQDHDGSAVPAELRTSQTFAVVTQIFHQDDKEAVAEHRLIFDGGVVYDINQLRDSEVTVFDPARQSVSLLNQAKKNQARISTRDLVNLVAGAKAAAGTKEKQDQLGLNAKVIDSDRLDGVSIRFSGLQYDVSIQKPEHPWMATDFARYSDLALRLNLLRRQGSPPFARMALGQHLASLGVLPEETFLTIRKNGTSERFRSMAVIEKVTNQDRQMIQDIQGMASLFEAVSFERFEQ